MAASFTPLTMAGDGDDSGKPDTYQQRALSLQQQGGDYGQARAAYQRAIRAYARARSRPGVMWIRRSAVSPPARQDSRFASKASSRFLRFRPRSHCCSAGRNASASCARASVRSPDDFAVSRRRQRTCPRAGGPADPAACWTASSQVLTYDPDSAAVKRDRLRNLSSRNGWSPRRLPTMTRGWPWRAPSAWRFTPS